MIRTITLGLATALFILGLNYLFNELRARLYRRRVAKRYEAAVARWRLRKKCKILKIGTVRKCECGCGSKGVAGFEFAPDPEVPEVGLGPRLEAVIHGWSVNELVEVAERPGEFTD